ncbi:TIGR02678 family protein [Peribacillus sp. SCS-26]|uniref:TIGR02678 family protein n=1 Tax=Paraperibacillus marinus TaxID=3115295 RepID=UPI003905CB66
METNVFDEKAKQGLRLLFDHYWIIRSEQPQWYQLIREREKVLRRYIDEKFGLQLILQRQFAKLEKIPVEPEAWMGIQHFQEQMDYAIFCCALSFLEGKAIDEQFLLSDLCEEIAADYPGDFPLDWTVYSHRKSLIRAVQMLSEFRLVRIIDGDVNKFDNNQEQEALYEATLYSRYFMRSYPEDLFQYSHWTEILQQEWKLQGDDERRKRVYRKLFMSPGMYRKQEQDRDFLYLRNFRNRMREDIEKHTEYQFSLFKNTALLMISEPKVYQTVFPNQKATSDLILQISHYLHSYKERYVPDEWGNIALTMGEFEQLLLNLKEQYGDGWSKAFREGSLAMVSREVLNAMEDWLMVERDTDTEMILFKPLLGLTAGSYPHDFKKEK